MENASRISSLSPISCPFKDSGPKPVVQNRKATIGIYQILPKKSLCKPSKIMGKTRNIVFHLTYSIFHDYQIQDPVYDTFMLPHKFIMEKTFCVKVSDANFIFRCHKLIFFVDENIIAGLGRFLKCVV